MGVLGLNVLVFLGFRALAFFGFFPGSTPKVGGLRFSGSQALGLGFLLRRPGVLLSACLERLCCLKNLNRLYYGLYAKKLKASYLIMFAVQPYYGSLS